MAFYNLPPIISSMLDAIDKRLTRLERAIRFSAPSVASLPTYPTTADIVYDSTNTMLKYWNGSAWVEIADNNVATSIITVNNATLKTANNNIVFTGQPLIIQYQKIGKMLTAFAEITGTTVSNWGTGQIYFQLPAGFPTFSHSVIASGAIQQSGTTYTIFGTINKGDNKMYLWSPTSNGGSDAVTYNKPAVLTTNAIITINGVAIIA